MEKHWVLTVEKLVSKVSFSSPSHTEVLAEVPEDLCPKPGRERLGNEGASSECTCEGSVTSWGSPVLGRSPSGACCALAAPRLGLGAGTQLDS